MKRSRADALIARDDRSGIAYLDLTALLSPLAPAALPDCELACRGIDLPQASLSWG